MEHEICGILDLVPTMQDEENEVVGEKEWEFKLACEIMLLPTEVMPNKKSIPSVLRSSFKNFPIASIVLSPSWEFDPCGGAIKNQLGHYLEALQQLRSFVAHVSHCNKLQKCSKNLFNVVSYSWMNHQNANVTFVLNIAATLLSAKIFNFSYVSSLTTAILLHYCKLFPPTSNCHYK